MSKKTLEERIKELEAWKQHCNIVTAGIGGIWMTVTTMAGLVYSYWDEIKHFFAGLK
jgi:hypothetical protein